MAEEAVLPGELDHTHSVQLASAPTPPPESGIQLTLNTALVHPTELAADHGWHKTPCPLQQQGLACCWPPVTHPAQQLCLLLCAQGVLSQVCTASWRCPLPTCICGMCSPATQAAAGNIIWLCVLQLLMGKVLGGQLQLNKYMDLISRSLTTWRPLCLCQPRTHSGKALLVQLTVGQMLQGSFAQGPPLQAPAAAEPDCNDSQAPLVANSLHPGTATL